PSTRGHRAGGLVEDGVAADEMPNATPPIVKTGAAPPATYTDRQSPGRRSAVPGLEAIVITLTHDTPVAEIHEHREARLQCLSCLEWTGAGSNRATPEKLHRHPVTTGDCPQQLEAFRAQQRPAAYPGFLERLQIARRTVRQQLVREFLLHDVRRIVLVDLIGAGPTRQRSDVAARRPQILIVAHIGIPRPAGRTTLMVRASSSSRGRPGSGCRPDP